LKNLAVVSSDVFLDPVLVQKAKRHLIVLGQKQHVGVVPKPTTVPLGIDQDLELLAG
jgi:hypothetical protein